MNETSFTLIELVIVMGILAVLAVVVIMVINPVEFLKQARDSNRLSDLQAIDKALGLYESDGGSSFGSSNTVYVSIPDSSATCDNLGLPDLPAGYSYACSDEDNFRKINGNGWIPVDLTTISFGGSPLNVLPIDPVNATSTGNYYTYVTGGSWELNAILESQKYRNSNACPQYLPGILKIGTNLSLSPIANTECLVGYWKFDEGEGTATTDSSGNNNTGTLTNGPSWQSESNCKLGGCLSFDGSNDYVDCGNGGTLNFGENDFTIEAWIKLDDYTSNTIEMIIQKQQNAIDRYYLCYRGESTDRIQGSVADGTKNVDVNSAGNAINNNNWHHITFVVDRVNELASIYVDGIQNGSDTTLTITEEINPSAALYIGVYSGGANYFNGFIDEVRIYSRALSSAEIQAIYNATR